jgi:subtilisin family serine protease
VPTPTTTLRTPIAFLLAVGLAASFSLAQPPTPTPTPTQPDTRIVVKTADDLPRHTYTIEGKPSEFLLTDAPFKAFVAKVKHDAEQDLAKYKIEDPTTLQAYHALLQQAAMLEGKWDEALAQVERIRALESKESKRLMAGQVLGSLVAARKASAPSSKMEAFDVAFKKELAARIGALPWDKVREEVTQAKGRAELITRDLILGQLKGQLDPVVESNKGELSSDLARGLIGARAAIDVILPLNPLIVPVYSSIIDSHKVVAKDIWSERLVTLTEKDAAKPVVAAIWDSGVDVAIFPGRVYVNPKETVNGKDDDANGYIDDVNGIAFDLRSDRTTDLLHPLAELRSDKALITSHTKGLMDLQANVDSPEASALKKFMSSLKPDQVSPFLEDLGLFGNYSHGTHVAGIASDGNPFIRLLPVRITFDFRQIPQITPSIAQAEKEAAAALDSVAYMHAAGVRVCNMSWGGSRKDIEQTLEKKGVGATSQERAELSRRLFQIQRDALEKAMTSAPEILFVAAAGNADNDNTFSEMLPSGLSLPNMITVGAVDQSGKPTSFTTFGKNVSLYANGFEVESSIPGGKKMKFSGTSMAAPNTTNLAAKLLALRPTLTTAEVIDLIRAGADPMEGYAGRTIINPKKSISLLRKGTGH